MLEQEACHTAFNMNLLHLQLQFRYYTELFRNHVGFTYILLISVLNQFTQRNVIYSLNKLKTNNPWYYRH